MLSDVLAWAVAGMAMERPADEVVGFFGFTELRRCSLLVRWKGETFASCASYMICASPRRASPTEPVAAARAEGDNVERIPRK